MNPDARNLYWAAVVALALFSVSVGSSKEARTIRLNEKTVGKITVTPGRTTILSFPSKPTKVILGNQGSYAIEYVDNDIAIAALTQTSKSNLFIYVDNRRYAFDLESIPSGGDEIVIVRDSLEGQVRVKIK